jgi:1-acyl-sn-glycerol-3-phosphate acyltransferase
LLYRVFKFFLTPALYFICRRIRVSNPEILKEPGPLLLACNHPNSFLDAVIIGLLFKQPVWSLTRGDVFTKRFYAWVLTSLKMLPVYRTSEGAGNLNKNYRTFDDCLDIFKRNGVILIFSEGKCINEWHLRSLKKGTARLAIKSWEENIPVKVLPVGINYSSYRRFGKNIDINFGDVITMNSINWKEPGGFRYQAFNKKLNEELTAVVYEISKTDRQLQKEKLGFKIPAFQKLLLAIPAGLGYLWHAPLYFPLQQFTWGRTNLNDHFDSVLSALLIFAYPMYLFALTLLCFLITGSAWSFILLVLVPFCAWAYIRVKPQVDG